MTTAMPPDPETTNGDPDLEPGGSVRPGSTPPDSGSTTAGLSHHEHDGARSMGPIVIGVLLVVSIAVGLLILASAVGWLG